MIGLPMHDRPGQGIFQFDYFRAIALPPDDLMLA
jgi:hypothetical protein